MNTILTIASFLGNVSSGFQGFLTSIGIWGGVLGSLLIIIESIIPVLPLCVFITLNFLTFGNIFGFIISWIFTCIGCSLSFFLCRYFFRDWFNNKFLKSEHDNFTKKLMNKINKMKLTSLATIVAIPFTPAFLINIIASQSEMSYKKFITAMLIGKVCMVYFWGYVGTTLIECLTNPAELIEVIVMVLLVYVLGKIINKVLKLD